MIRTNYTVEDLKKLPLRAIVAFAARCARRVESFAQFPADHPQHEARRLAIDNAIRLAEEISRGSACARGSRPHGGNRLARPQPRSER